MFSLAVAVVVEGDDDVAVVVGDVEVTFVFKDDELELGSIARTVFMACVRTFALESFVKA